jgi:ATP-binding cassette subfamily F protein 3
LDPPNVLLLDEPTTHQDMASVDALIEALTDFEGTICFISHDLYFVNALANHVAHVDQGRAKLYTGNHDDFLRLSQRLSAAGTSPSAEVPAARPANAARPTNVGGPAWMKTGSDDLKRLREAERARSKRRKKLNERLRELESEIEDFNRQMGSVFIQSDYQKLMELDAGLKKCQKERDEVLAGLQES